MKTESFEGLQNRSNVSFNPRLYQIYVVRPLKDIPCRTMIVLLVSVFFAIFKEQWFVILPPSIN